MTVDRKATYYQEKRFLKNGVTELVYMCIVHNVRMKSANKVVIREGIRYLVHGYFCTEPECKTIFEAGYELLGPTSMGL